MLVLVDSGILLRLLERTDPQHGVIRGAVRAPAGPRRYPRYVPPERGRILERLHATGDGPRGTRPLDRRRRSAAARHRAALSSRSRQPCRLPDLAWPARRPRGQWRTGARREARCPHAGPRDHPHLDAQRSRLRPLPGHRSDRSGEPFAPSPCDPVTRGLARPSDGRSDPPPKRRRPRRALLRRPAWTQHPAPTGPGRRPDRPHARARRGRRPDRPAATRPAPRRRRSVAGRDRGRDG